LETDGRSQEEITEALAESEARSRSEVLEMIGDIPYADIKPPENVLFVCKLNPVTADEDLEIIFSRFGRIKSCEVIRDQKTKESLQYAFIEFEDRKACEDAYFKMDNVLIDDRRIHVDFSQSVSKYKWKGKGRGVQVFEDKKSEEKFAKRQNPWIRPNNNSKEVSTKTMPDKSRTVDAKRSHPSLEESKKHWSRSPPRYSRGHATEQKRKSEHAATDDKLLALLKKELLNKEKRKKKKNKDKGKKKRKQKKSASNSEEDSTSSDSSESDSSEEEASKSRKSKR